MVIRMDNVLIKKLVEKECCPECTNIEACKPYEEKKSYKWSKECCEKCNDTTCSQSPFYILGLVQNDKKERKDLDRDTTEYYVEEALKNILSS